jgi:hypothetical protein
MGAGPVSATNTLAAIARLEQWLRSWNAVGVVLLALLGLFVALLAFG